MLGQISFYQDLNLGIDTDDEVEVKITFTWVPYQRASHTEPEDGGFPESMQCHILSTGRELSEKEYVQHYAELYRLCTDFMEERV